jgi:hypothetical protein
LLDIDEEELIHFVNSNMYQEMDKLHNDLNYSMQKLDFLFKTFETDLNVSNALPALRLIFKKYKTINESLGKYKLDLNHAKFRNLNKKEIKIKKEISPISKIKSVDDKRNEFIFNRNVNENKMNINDSDSDDDIPVFTPQHRFMEESFRRNDEFNLNRYFTEEKPKLIRRTNLTNIEPIFYNESIRRAFNNIVEENSSINWNLIYKLGNSTLSSFSNIIYHKRLLLVFEMKNGWSIMAYTENFVKNQGKAKVLIINHQIDFEMDISKTFDTMFFARRNNEILFGLMGRNGKYRLVYKNMLLSEQKFDDCLIDLLYGNIIEENFLALNKLFISCGD